MKPPKHIDLNTWFRKHCYYEPRTNRHGRKYHFFWLPHREYARIWPFRSNTGDYPEREISRFQTIEERWQ